MTFSYGRVVPIVAALFLPLLCIPGCSDPSTERIHSIDFETFVDGIPVGMEMTIGATTGETQIENLIEQDTSIFHSGGASLRIIGSPETTDWRAFSVDIPTDVRRVTVKLFVKSEDLQQELNQFGNRYAGFWYDDLLGNSANELISLPSGTSDWTEVTVSLDKDAFLAENVEFMLFSSVSGKLWIDDLTFIYDDDCTDQEERVLQEPLSSYIDEISRPTTFMELALAADGDCPDSISANEALEDAEMLRYLFENAYSGYAYWQNQGVDFNAVYENLILLTEGSDSVSVVEMERVIAEGLAGIQDGHLGVTGHQRRRFLERKTPFFTEVIVEHSSHGNEEYRVIRSNSDAVQPGMIYVGPEDRLFRILSRNGVEQFQLGVFTTEYANESVFEFLSSSASAPIIPIALPLHECRLKSNQYPSEEIFCTTDVDGIDLVLLSSFSTSHHQSLLEFAEIGTELAETDRFIVNLMGNSGGSSSYGMNFITNLNSVAEWKMYYAVLYSPATIASTAVRCISEDMRPESQEELSRLSEALEPLRERPFRNWMYLRDELSPRQMGDYQGTAVFLINRKVASAGEALIDYSKSVPGAVLVGENSAGVGTFGEVLSYWLPNSHIKLSLPSKLFLMPGFEEGVGYIPDYWLDSQEPVAEIARWLNNPDSYQFEFPLSPVLHDLSFNEFENGIPLHMEIRVGATSGIGRQLSQISQDSDIKTEGNSSLRLEGDIDTDRWNSLFIPVPETTGSLNVVYSVRGEGINCEGNQFANCYVGFIYKDSEGNRQFSSNCYYGNFDWKKDSLQINIEELRASDIDFCVFLSMSGTLWIDDVVFSE